MQSNNSERTEIQAPLPRVRALLEFVEGDPSQQPIVYPIITAGSDEQDDELRREILKRWDRG